MTEEMNTLMLEMMCELRKYEEEMFDIFVIEPKSLNKENTQ